MPLNWATLNSCPALQDLMSDYYKCFSLKGDLSRGGGVGGARTIGMFGVPIRKKDTNMPPCQINCSYKQSPRSYQLTVSNMSGSPQ